MRLLHSRLRYRIQDALRAVGEFLEDQWFDRTRRVRTSRNLELAHLGVAPAQRADSSIYQPARPRHIRRAIRDLAAAGQGIGDLAAFSFVDLGSGKGRTLFAAAEFPFRRIIGVEFSPALHALASANLRTFRGGRGTATRIEAIEGDAREFVFPSGPLVLYMFNPFGASTMQQVLQNLARSLVREPRHLLVILLWPRCADQVARLPGATRICERREYQIFEVRGPAAALAA